MDKADVLDRIIILLKDKSLQRNIATLLAIVFITKHQGQHLEANAVPLSHNDFLFLTNLAHCIEFLNIYDSHETIIKRFRHHLFSVRAVDHSRRIKYTAQSMQYNVVV